MPDPFDLSLYLITDPAMTARRGLIATVAEAVAGGVTVVQLRHKEGSARSMVEMGRALRALLVPHGIPLIVNDRVDVAYAIGADGVHVGASDLPPAVVRAILGPRAIVGLSVFDETQAANVDGSVDYVGLGPIFPTGSKPDAAPPLGIARFSTLRSRLSCRVVAIGGIGVINAADAIAAGADGIAVLSAICAANDPGAAARALRAVIAAARRSGPSRAKRMAVADDCENGASGRLPKGQDS